MWPEEFIRQLLIQYYLIMLLLNLIVIYDEHTGVTRILLTSGKIFDIDNVSHKMTLAVQSVKLYLSLTSLNPSHNVFFHKSLLFHSIDM